MPIKKALPIVNQKFYGNLSSFNVLLFTLTNNLHIFEPNSLIRWSFKGLFNLNFTNFLERICTREVRGETAKFNRQVIDFI